MGTGQIVDAAHVLPSERSRQVLKIQKKDKTINKKNNNKNSEQTRDKEKKKKKKKEKKTLGIKVTHLQA